MVTLNFNVNSVQADSFDALPAGWYEGFIDNSELKPTRSGGAMLVLRWNLTTAGFNGRKIFQNMNIYNSNPTAQEIAFKQLSSIGKACGLEVIQTSTQLHNIPCRLKLKVRTDPTGQYEDSNEVTMVKGINEGGAPQAPQMPQAPVMNAAPAAPQIQMAAPQAAPQPQQQVPAFMTEPVNMAPTIDQQAVAAMQQAAIQPAPQQAWQAAPQQPWEQPQQAAPQPAPQPQQAPAQAANLPPWMQ